MSRPANLIHPMIVGNPTPGLPNGQTWDPSPMGALPEVSSMVIAANYSIHCVFGGSIPDLIDSVSKTWTIPRTTATSMTDTGIMTRFSLRRASALGSLANPVYFGTLSSTSPLARLAAPLWSIHFDDGTIYESLTDGTYTGSFGVQLLQTLPVPILTIDDIAANPPMLQVQFRGQTPAMMAAHVVTAGFSQNLAFSSWQSPGAISWDLTKTSVGGTQTEHFSGSITLT